MSDFSSMGRGLTILGLMLAAVGVFWWSGGKLPPLGRLPGDIRMEGGHFNFYFPITTCLLVSAIGSILLWLFSKFK